MMQNFGHERIKLARLARVKPPSYLGSKEKLYNYKAGNWIFPYKTQLKTNCV